MNAAAGISVILFFIFMVVMIGIGLYQEENNELASSFTHYSDSTWQVNDTVYWRHGADTIKLDVSKLK